MRLPKKIPTDQTLHSPVTSLDIFPKVLSEVGIQKTRAKPLDGVNLLPYLDYGQAVPSRT